MATLEQVLTIVSQVEQSKNRYIKKVLTEIERTTGKSVDPEIRKIVLDGFNDHTRTIHTIIGYMVER